MEDQMIQTHEEQVIRAVEVDQENRTQTPKTSPNIKFRNLFIIVAAVVAAAIIWWVWPRDPIIIKIASSNTKEDWIEAAIKEFQATNPTTTSGREIIVEADHVLSGGSMDELLDGSLKPTVWSPGDEYWVDQLQKQQNLPFMSQDSCPNTIYSPLGIAMWQPMAEALGWPNKQLGWADMIALAEDPEGWPSYGISEWGKFQFGHAHPRYSNAGLQAMASFVYGLADTQDPELVDVYRLEDEMQALQQNTSKYGTDTIDLLDLMVREGPDFLHAVATYEPQMLKVQLEQADELRFPLVFIFPKEGTFWSGHPYCILDETIWVKQDPDQIEASEKFLAFLNEPNIQKLAITSRLRPINSDTPLREPFTRENGTNGTVTIDDIPPLPNPNAEIGEAIVDLFQKTKRKATVAIVLDTSGSMKDDNAIKVATDATSEFLLRLDGSDIVTVLTFNDEVENLSEPVRVGDSGTELAQRVRRLVATGNTALNQAICEATILMEDLQAQDKTQGESRLYGIILLSDGEDTEGDPNTAEMFNCLPEEAEPEGIKIFPIAFGDKADKGVLSSVATLTGGQVFEADIASIDDIYLAISAEQ